MLLKYYGGLGMIGRNYLSTEGTSLEEEFLSYFINMAVDPKPDDQDLSESDEYLSLFIAHTEESTAQYSEVMQELHVGVQIKYSRFISSFSQLDPSSGIGLIRLSSAIVPPTGMTVFSEDASLICYSLIGEGEVIVDGKGIRCKKYDCVWTDVGRRVQYRGAPGKPWECAFIRVHGKPNSSLFAEACKRLKNNSMIHLTFGAGTRFRSLVWQLLSVRTQSSYDPDLVYTHLLLNLFVEIDLAIISSSVKQMIVPDIITAIQGYIDKNYSREISLDELSRVFSISKYHMSREFKRYVGKSPNDYLIDLRISKAKELLVDSKRKIADIGQLVGIPNTNHFLYLFKTREGITPSAFRKQRI
ncbi:MAG: AraC family transcriptional regulator [Clostridia bacterium]|nr:AraC family transcriptional regulator [Clostridia bacterium]